jgi:hypothetical protein
MKRFLKKYDYFLSIKHYIAFLRRQPKHMQHVYAVFFAGAITAIAASGILYYDYGFWRDTYHRGETNDLVVVEKKNVDTQDVITQSPGQMMGDFLKEAGDRFRSIHVNSKDILQGKEEYKSNN